MGCRCDICDTYNSILQKVDILGRGVSPSAPSTAVSCVELGRPKVGLGIYIYSCHAGELFGFVPVARDEQAFSC